MPDEGVVGWDDAVRGRIEFANENLADLVLVRSDGRPTYNFASPVEDMLDGITHVIRGNDHVSNTPTQINILPRARRRAAGLRARPGRARRRRQEALQAPRGRLDRRLPRRRLPAGGADELPRAARLELRRQDDDDEPGRADRALLARAGRPEPGDLRLPEARLAERHAPARARARASTPSTCLAWLREQGNRLARGARARDASRSCRRRSRSSPQYPDFVRFLFEPVEPDGADPEHRRAAREALAAVEPWEAAAIEQALRALAEAARPEAARGVRADPARGHRARRSRRACSRASSCSGKTTSSLARGSRGAPSSRGPVGGQRPTGR